MNQNYYFLTISHTYENGFELSPLVWLQSLVTYESSHF